MRRSAGDVAGDRKTMAVCDRHDFTAFTSASRADSSAPFFAELKLVDEGLRQIQFAAGPQVFCEGVQESRQGPVALPLLEAAMASLIGRIAVGQIVPGSAGAQHPKNPVEHGAGILSWSPSLPNWFRVKEKLQNRPLGVGEVHVAMSTHARASTIFVGP